MLKVLEYSFQSTVPPTPADVASLVREGAPHGRCERDAQ